MGVSISIDGAGTIGDIGKGWSVSEEASPLNPANNQGATSYASVGAVAHDTSRFIQDNFATFTDETLGDHNGVIANIGLQGSAVTFTVDSVATLLNVQRTAQATGSQPLSEIFAAYVALVTPIITVDYQAASNPLRVYPGWTGEVWTALKALCAANNVEMAVVGNRLVVRSVGSVTLTVDDVSLPQIRQNIKATGRSIECYVVNPSLVSTIGTIKHNYSANPSMESNNTGWVGNNGAGLTMSSARTADAAIDGAFLWKAEVLTYTTPATASYVVNHTIDVTALDTVQNHSYAVQFIIAPAGPILISDKGRYKSIVSQGIWYNSGGAVLRRDPVEIFSIGVFPFLPGPTSHRFITSNVKKPVGATSLIIYVRSTAGTPTLTTDGTNWTETGENFTRVGEILKVDAAIVTEGSIVPYFDGSDAGCVWTGAANNSVSTQTIAAGNTFYDAQVDGNTIYSVDIGQTEIFSIPTNNFATYLAAPVQQTARPLLTGGYIVSDSLGVAVSVADWSSYGGNVTVEIDPDEQSVITLTLKGPTSTIPGYTGPFALATVTSDVTVAALSIAGTGVTTSPERIYLLTGADETKITTEIATRIASPFISDAATLYDRGNWAAIEASSGATLMTFNIATKRLTGFGLTCGATFRYQDAKYRVINVQIGRTVSQITAQWHTTIGEMDTAWSGQTLGAFDTKWTGYSAGDIQIAPLDT